jgi:hypothetical protein
VVVTAVLPDLLAALARAEVNHQFVGAAACLAHGLSATEVPLLATAELDVVVVRRPPHDDRLLQALALTFAVERPGAPNAPWRATHRASVGTVAVHALPDTDHDRLAIRRAQRLPTPLSATPLRCATVEDLVLWTLRQPRDDDPAQPPAMVLALLRARAGRLNHCYLLEWSERIGVAEPLDDALAAVRC